MSIGWTVGPLEIIVVILVVLLLFGAKRLPELARSLGRSLNEFKKGKAEGEKEEEKEEGRTGLEDKGDKDNS